MSSNEVDSEVAQNRIMKIVAPLMQKIAPENRAIFLAMAERLAGSRYREWTIEVENVDLKKTLIECAEREELIADKIESMYPNASEVIAQISADNPDLNNLQDAVFGDYNLRMQFAIQAQGERRGHARWHLFAEKVTDPKAIKIFNDCADLEMASAIELEKVLGQNLV